MTLVLTDPVNNQINGRMREVTVTITGPASYATGGIPFSPLNLFGMALVQIVLFSPASAQGFLPSWDYAANKVKLWSTGAAANAVLNEVPNTTNVTTNVMRAVFRGL
jgi:hypothetical protein